MLLNEKNVVYEPTYKNGTLLVTEKDQIFVKCLSEEIQINGKVTTMYSTNITCINGIKFKVEGYSGDVSFDNIQCTSFPRSRARYTGKNCLNNKNYKEIEIGYDLGKKFLRNNLICFDAVNQSTLYSSFNMSDKIKAAQINIPRPDFIEGSFYNIGNKNVNNLYVRGTQRKTINQLLGMTNNNYTIIGKSNDYFLSRGHLTAKADFIYGYDQRSTFYYVNAAPQWQTFNEGNWNELEQSIRYFVGNGVSNVTVYTGTYGITTLPHANNGRQTQLHLYVDNGKRGIPVPEIYWKIIYNPVKQLGTAFVGVNDPYYGKKHKKLCNDISSDIPWLRLDSMNVTAGISYTCTVDDLRKSVKTIPVFTVKGVLK